MTSQLVLATILLVSFAILTEGSKGDACECEKLAAKEYTGNSLDFQGRPLVNAELINTTFGDGIDHLNVESLGILSEMEVVGSGVRIATIDSHGGIFSQKALRWDNDQLRLPALASFSPSGLQVRSDLDLTNHYMRNLKFEPESELREIRVADSVLADVAIHNATATDLTLEDVKVDTIRITTLETSQGALVGIGADGEVVASDAIWDDKDELTVNRNTRVHGNLDMSNNNIENAVLTSGSIKGDSIEVDVRSVTAESITLLKNKGGDRDSILLVDGDGNLKGGSIIVDDGGWMQDAKVSGTINFRGNLQEDEASGRLVEQQGRILDAYIQGGYLDKVEGIDVSGDTVIGGTMSVQGDAFIHSGLTVSGSVLGSGPYIDMSDARLKTNIEDVANGEITDALASLRAVSYELQDPRVASDDGAGSKAQRLMAMNMSPPPPQRQIGFIAQEVEAIFPELVSVDKDGYRGVQYARFVPLLVEALKEMQEENLGLRYAVNTLDERVAALEKAAAGAN